MKFPYSDPKIVKALDVIRAYGKVPPKIRFLQKVKAGIIDKEGRPKWKALFASARYGSGGRVSQNSPPVGIEIILGLAGDPKGKWPTCQRCLKDRRYTYDGLCFQCFVNEDNAPETK
jgi:hypothetical protein